MNIYLVSSLIGAKTQLESYIKDFPSREIVFIPTASLKSPTTKYVDEAREYFNDHGFIIKDLEVSTTSEDEAKKVIENADILYLSGGNSFYLLQELKKKNLLELIKKRVEADMVYIGESAGAIIAGPNIEYSKYMDEISEGPELTSYDALNIVDFYLVPHYGEEPFVKEAKKIVGLYGEVLDLVAIDNQSAVVVTNGNFIYILEI